MWLSKLIQIWAWDYGLRSLSKIVSYLSQQPCTQSFFKIRHCYLMIWWWLYVQMALQSENLLDVCPFRDIPLAVQNCILFSRWRILVAYALVISLEKKKRKISHRHRGPLHGSLGAHPPFGPWSRRGLNPIKPVYDPDRPDGQLSWLNYLIGDLG